jgi:hypothetical protein
MSAFWRDLDVSQSGACSVHGARPDRPRHGIRAIDAARRLGRRRQFGDIRRAVRPGQSQGALRSQRHRQRREYPAAPLQSTTAGSFLRFGRAAGAAHTPRAAALYRRLAADHQRTPSLPAKTAGSAAGATGDEQFHGDLPGVLGIKLRSCGGAILATERAFRCRAPRGTIFSCQTYSKLSSAVMRTDTEYRVTKNGPSGRDGGE